VKNVDLRGALKQHWTRRWSDLDPKKAGEVNRSASGAFG
jgi:hypothetical protein